MGATPIYMGVINRTYRISCQPKKSASDEFTNKLNENLTNSFDSGNLLKSDLT